MILHIPFNLGEIVQDRITEEILQVIGIEYRNGKIGNDHSEFHDVLTINTTGGIKRSEELRHLNGNFVEKLIDDHGV